MNSTLAINQPSMLPAAAESTAAAQTQVTSTTKAEKTAGDDQIFGPGLGVLRQYMQLLTQLANEHHQKMKEHGDLSTEAQDIVSKIDACIADIDAKSEGKFFEEPIGNEDPIVKYIEKNEFLDVDYFLSERKKGKNEHSKKVLVALKGSVQKYATENSDINARYQQQIQKTMQTYNVTVSLMNSLQTMLGDMTKQFAQAIR